MTAVPEVLRTVSYIHKYLEITCIGVYAKLCKSELTFNANINRFWFCPVGLDLIHPGRPAGKHQGLLCVPSEEVNIFQGSV